MTLNEEVARALGWTRWPGSVSLFGADDYWRDSELGMVGNPDFSNDWNAVYRWIVPAVKEMEAGDRELFVEEMMTFVAERINDDWPDFLDATTEDYCRAFLKVTK